MPRTNAIQNAAQKAAADQAMRIVEDLFKGDPTWDELRERMNGWADIPFDNEEDEKWYAEWLEMCARQRQKRHRRNTNAKN